MDDVSLADFLLAIQPRITKGVLILFVEGDVVDEVFAECLDGLLVDFSLFQALLAEVVGLL